MKFNVNSYHFNLLRDFERLAVFKEAISDFADDNGFSSKIRFESNTSKIKLTKDSSKIKLTKDSSKIKFDKNSSRIAFDLGCGSGILSYFASEYFDKVIAIDKDSSIIKCARENLKSFKNIEIYNVDVLNFDFEKISPKADLIICEMMDTALIDEEEIPVLNYAKQFLKDDGKIIPEAIINVAAPVFMDNHYLQYEDNESHPIYDVLGHPIIYSQFNFLDDIDEKFSCILEFNIFDKDFLSTVDNLIFVNKHNFKNKNHDENSKILDTNHDEIFKNNLRNCNNLENNIFNNEDIVDKKISFKINGIKLSSFTKLNDNLICGPTAMFNPCILVPVEEINIKAGEKIKIQLDYVMGGGIETIKTNIIK